MSLANARKHWRVLAILLLVFLALAAAGPVIFYGVPLLFSAIVNGSGVTRWTLFLILTGAPAGWFFFALWAGAKADRATSNGASGGRRIRRDG